MADETGQPGVPKGTRAWPGVASQGLGANAGRDGEPGETGGEPETGGEADRRRTRHREGTADRT